MGKHHRHECYTERNPFSCWNDFCSAVICLFLLLILLVVCCGDGKGFCGF
ncbi:MAG TPA: hypothetical protein GX391_00200 [Firmicutes bacterium]|nr:hypothetical protein [Bacillota bacterium]HOQ24188.1 hypothetical protein [Bacillota bacterium]HPT67599.1 hypothetical protein [Bacillota bacterium]